MVLYHFFDKRSGPFRTLSDLPEDKAKSMLETFKRERPGSQCAQRHDKYIEYRHNCENILRREFARKGGIIRRQSPYYMVIGYSPWLSTWFEDCGVVKIPIVEFDLRTVSFTYGDSMPTFSPTINDGREYRHQIYTYNEILRIIDKYGLPQDWNDDGMDGPERYIEAHVWSDEPICRYKQTKEET